MNFIVQILVLSTMVAGNFLVANEQQPTPLSAFVDVCLGKSHAGNHFKADDLTALDADYIERSEMALSLPEAVMVLNYLVEDGTLTAEQATTDWIHKFRSANNAFEFLKVRQALATKFGRAIALSRAGAEFGRYSPPNLETMLDHRGRPPFGPTVSFATKEIRPVEYADDLPESYFMNLAPSRALEKKALRWRAVRDLDDNDPRKVLYYRRFPEESPCAKNWDRADYPLARSNPFQYYELDPNSFSRLPSIPPYNVTLQIPEKVKIGIVIGMHHLEKPWGNLLREMILRQVKFPANRILFIDVQNQEIPTGMKALRSENEVTHAILELGLTHVIEVHEQFSFGNHYMDAVGLPNSYFSFKPSKFGGSRVMKFTLDPFVPLWTIEQYYDGKIYPQLQHAVNDQIRKIQLLINGAN